MKGKGRKGKEKKGKEGKTKIWVQVEKSIIKQASFLYYKRKLFLYQISASPQ